MEPSVECHYEQAVVIAQNLVLVTYSIQEARGYRE